VGSSYNAAFPKFISDCKLEAICLSFTISTPTTGLPLFYMNQLVDDRCDKVTNALILCHKDSICVRHSTLFAFAPTVHIILQSKVTLGVIKTKVLDKPFANCDYDFFLLSSSTRHTNQDDLPPIAASTSPMFASA